MRREPLLAVLLCVLGAGTVLVSAGRTWIQLDGVPNPLLPPRVDELTGAALVPGLRPLGLAGLAGVLGIVASRGAGRVLVGVLLVAIGAATCAVSFEHLAGTAWPWLALAGGVLLAAAGLLVTVRGRRWSSLGRRHEPPSARPVAERDLWEALDRGEDPTARG
jgi:hypothetical protein